MWRKDVIEFALDFETKKTVEEQLAWIASDPANARPYYNLAQLYRMQYKQDEGLALLLEAVRLDPRFAEAHAALSEIYAVKRDYAAAWRHARAAEREGNGGAASLLARFDIAEPPMG